MLAAGPLTFHIDLVFVENGAILLVHHNVRAFASHVYPITVPEQLLRREPDRVTLLELRIFFEEHRS